MGTWRKLYDARFKVQPHITSEANVEVIRDYLMSRGSAPEMERTHFGSEFHHTPGGYQNRAIDWPKREFKLGEKKLILDVDCVTQLLWEMKTAHPDFCAAGKQFHYSKNLKYLLTLDNIEKDNLIELLEAGRSEADEIAQEFSRRLEEKLISYYNSYKATHTEEPSYLRLTFPLITRGN